MSAICELTQKSGQYGNNVSHSQIKTRRKFDPNLQNIGFYSNALGMKLRFQASTRAIKTVDKYGGIDAYLMSAKSILLSSKALKLKKMIIKASPEVPSKQ